MAEFFRFLVESNLTTAAFVIGAFAFIIAIIGRVKTIIEPSPAMRLALALFGFWLMAISIGSYFFSLQAPPEATETPVWQPQQPTAVIATQEPPLSAPSSSQVTQQPSATPTQAVLVATQVTPSTSKPATPEEAAALFGGPPASEWKPCPGEPVGCWTFSLPGTSYRVSVPEQCLRPDGSIDGWRYGGGYPSAPDAIEGNVRIWETLEAATIRCH